MIDYVFYRLSRLSQRSSVPEAAGLIALFFFGTILSCDILSIWGLLRVGQIVSYFPTKREFVIMHIILLFLFGCYFFINSRYKRIISKYKAKRLTPLREMSVYVISFALFVICAYYYNHTFNGK